MNKEYLDLFSWVEKILDKQQKQKFRGLNNYNMVNVVRKATHEVGMHSNIIYSLINPKGDHYQDDLFLNLFIELVILPKLELNKLEDFGIVHSVHVEEQTDQNRRIDFTIKSSNYLIGIEMKVNALDLDNQISDYYDYLKEESSGEKVHIFYLTKNGQNASKRSIGKIEDEDTDVIKNISFSKDILNWINASQAEVKNIMNLNIALEDYKNIVRKITNQYKGNIVNIKDELLQKEHESHLLNALKLDKDMNYIKGKVLYNFFEKISIKFKVKNIDIFNTSSTVISNRIFDEQKCMKFFSVAKNKPTFFGQLYDLKNEKCLFVYVAKASLSYGIIENKYIKKDFNKEKIKTSDFISLMSSSIKPHDEYKVADNIDKMIDEKDIFNKLQDYLKTGVPHVHL